MPATPYSYRQYAGNGSNKSFAVSFPYLLKSHVQVFIGYNLLDGTYTSQLVDGVGFTWSSATAIQTTVAPSSAQVLTIVRKTPATALEVQWQDGSTLLADDMTTADLQLLYLDQEREDRVVALQVAFATAGVVGATGPRGATGVTGATGVAGATGPAGSAGSAGTAGATGATGPAGSAGAAGAAGNAGATGATGPAGGAGATGPAGGAGTAGATGATGPGGSGATGATGPAGSAGSAGTAGATGATGPAGSPGGATGATGPAGAAGATGPAGTAGAAGATGPAGTAGATGATGPAGTAGSVGATGATGTAGTAGVTGATGPLGPAGSPIVFVDAKTGSAVTGATSLVVSKPTGIQVGDLLVLVFLGISTNPNTYPTPTPPTGFTSAANTTRNYSTTTVFTKSADTSDVAASTFTINWTGNGGTYGMAAILAAYRNVDSSTPIDVTPVTVNNLASSATVTAPSITPFNSAIKQLLSIYSWSDGGVGGGSSGTVTPPAGQVLRATQQDPNSGTKYGSITLADETYSSLSATGTRVATASSSAPSMGISLLLRLGSTIGATGASGPAGSAGGAGATGATGPAGSAGSAGGAGATGATGPAGGGASLSDATPAALGTAAAGTSSSASRGDHIHAMPSASDVGALPTTFNSNTITYAATVDLGMSALNGAYRTISLTGNLTLTTSNRAAGRTVVLRLICDSTQRTLTFPAGWVFVGTKPANIAASKTAILSLSFFGTADTDGVAAYAVQS